MKGVRRRFWLEMAAGIGCAVSAVLTLVSKEWIEIVFRVDPDHGSGALEWSITVAFAVSALTLSWAARREWRTADA
jgi:hypothetical protein